MTPKELDAYDRTIAEWMGWEKDPRGGWRHTELGWWRYISPSPTREPADTAALEDYLWEKKIRVFTAPNEFCDVFAHPPDSDLVWRGLGETRALALCEAVVKMIEEGSK